MSDFAINVNKLLDNLPDTYLGRNISGQLSRSSASPALNYGEAQHTESTKDFLHKMRICLKELRETYVGLKIIERGKLTNKDNQVLALKNEANELISIFVSSINTASKSI